MLKNIISLSLIILIVYTLPSNAVSADVFLDKDSWGDSIIVISGKIQRGDLIKIKEKSSNLILASDEYSNNLHFHLNTGGGDVVEAMRIGRFARKILAEIDSYGKIIIAPGSKDKERFTKKEKLDPDYVLLHPTSKVTSTHIVRNHSAGILIFYGAVKRAHRDNSDQRLGFHKAINIPVMGLHRPYYEKEYYSSLSPSEASGAYKKLEKEVRGYLLEMGAPQSLLDRMFKSSSNRIDLIIDDEFRKYYKPEAPFIEEWLIAKCGATGKRNILQGKELNDFSKMQIDGLKPTWTVIPEAKGGRFSSTYSQRYIDKLFYKVRSYNFSVNSCRNKAIFTHQKEWAIKFKGS